MRSAGQKWVEPSATDLVSQYRAMEEDSNSGRRGVGVGGVGGSREVGGEGEGWGGQSEEGGKGEGKRRVPPLTVQVASRTSANAGAWMSAKSRMQATRAGAAGGGGGEVERVGGGMGDGAGPVTSPTPDTPVHDSPETRIRDSDAESKNVNEVLAAISGVKNQLRSLMGQVPGGKKGEAGGDGVGLGGVQQQQARGGGGGA